MGWRELAHKKLHGNDNTELVHTPLCIKISNKHKP